MYNSKIKTLKQVLYFYEDHSGSKMKNLKVKPNQRDPLVYDLYVNFKGVSLFVAFLYTLNDPDFTKSLPIELPVKGNIQSIPLKDIVSKKCYA
ncbi:MAG: hypothetical protein ACI9DJ_001503 [Algoriphagus sp.]|jgi:hypothetical protein